MTNAERGGRAVAGQAGLHCIEGKPAGRPSHLTLRLTSRAFPMYKAANRVAVPARPDDGGLAQWGRRAVEYLGRYVTRLWDDMLLLQVTKVERFVGP
jgi:hypothetical protein